MSLKKTVHRRPWTEEEDKKLRKLARSGASVAVMAISLGRNKNSVHGRISRLSINTFSVNPRALLDYLESGGCLVCDDNPPLGKIWTTASRTGLKFSTPDCDELLSSGVLQKHPQGNAVWCLKSAIPRWNEL